MICSFGIVFLTLFRRNVGENLTPGCRFDFGTNYFCPIISVGQIIDMLRHPHGRDPYTFDELAVNVRTSMSS